jgi:hypothetical protein
LPLEGSCKALVIQRLDDKNSADDEVEFGSKKTQFFVAMTKLIGIIRVLGWEAAPTTNPSPGGLGVD